MIGVIGSANQWTEPLSVMAAQNALYQTDAGENEGMGFAYANAQAGVPWVIVRGISDSPWYPATYHGVLAADRSANVSIYIVDHFSTNNLDSFASMNTLSPDSNAALHGYLIASQAYYSVSNVTQVQYQASNGSTIVVYNPSGNEYQLANSNQFSQYVYTPSTNGTTSSSSGTSSSY
jgi:adenosylhomocysteine nucleosidase